MIHGGLARRAGMWFTISNRRMFGIAAEIPLRSDFNAGDLHHLARNSRDANQARRLLALAAMSSITHDFLPLCVHGASVALMFACIADNKKPATRWSYGLIRGCGDMQPSLPNRTSVAVRVAFEHAIFRL